MPTGWSHQLRRSAAALLLGAPVLAFVVASSASSAAATVACTSASQVAQPFTIPVDGQPANGFFSLPASAPRGIVAVGHGHTQSAKDMIPLLEKIASDDDVIAFAEDYRGTDLSNDYGWRVVEGAQDTIAGTKMFDGFCANSASFINTVFGLSMGGNMSGIAVASGAKRSDGQPLFDYWFDVSGVTNLAELYTQATVIAQVPDAGLASVGATAIEEMSQEFGGPFSSDPVPYLESSPALLAPEMKISGLRGVVITHGVADGEVTSDQEVQMASQLALAGIPTDMYTSVFKTPGTASGTTLDELVALIPDYSSPFAGHINAVIVNGALDRLSNLYRGGPAPSGFSLTLNDGELGTIPLVHIPAISLF